MATILLGVAGCAPSAPAQTSPPSAVPSPTAPAVSVVTPHPNAMPRDAAPASGQTVSYAIAPTDYAEARIRGDARLEKLPDGSIRVVSTRASEADQYVEWLVEDERIMPPGRQASRVLTVVCGRGSGDWWEVYGPYGSEEFEYEVTEPGADGCWRFNEVGRYTDFRVEIWLSGDAEMTISRIEFRVTYA